MEVDAAAACKLKCTKPFDFIKVQATVEFNGSACYILLVWKCRLQLYLMEVQARVGFYGSAG